MRPPPAARRLLAALALGALVACGRSEPEGAAGLPLPRALTLPVSGTIGDLPAPGDRLLVTLDADGVLALGGREVEIRDLVERLARATDGPRLREPDGSSRLDLLLAADASVPWRAVVWVLMAAAHPRVKAYRICFAVAPERGSEMGALAAFLPRDRSLGPPELGEPAGVARLVRGDGPPPDAAALEEAIAALPDPRRRSVLLLEADGFAPHGEVVALMDAGYRAGVSEVQLHGGGIVGPKEGETIRDLVAAARSERGSLTLLWEGSPLPPASRRRAVPAWVRGHPAGPWYPSSAAPGDPTPPAETPETVEDLPFEEVAVERPRPPMVFQGSVRREGPPHEAKLKDEPVLVWLRSHQASDGRWGERDFDRWCDGVLRAGAPSPEAGRDVLATGLALQAFLAHGYANRGQHPFAKTVAKGLRWLKSVQGDDGWLGDPSSPTALHDHAVATLALVEAFGMTESPIYKGAAQRALDVLAAHHHPGHGWGRGGLRDPEDLATTAWVALVLCTAKGIVRDAVKRGKQEPLVPDREGLAAALSLVERWTDRSTGVVRDPAGTDGVSREAATGMGALVRLVAGEDPKDSLRLAQALAWLAARPPALAEDGSVPDPLAVCWGAFATFHGGGDAGKAWSEPLSALLSQGARPGSTPCEAAGAYDPSPGAAALPGGRLAATALLALAGSVFYRYDTALPCGR